jgi:F-type H+-transporting ATPase subunit epsilon
MEVLPDRVTILADVGENVVEIDIERAEKARARAEELLRRPGELEKDQYEAIEAALRRSNLRLGAARRYLRMSRRPLGLGPAKEE